MKRLRSHGPKSVDGISLELTPSTDLVIGISESPRARIKRLVSETPVLVFSRPSCCMRLVMTSLLSAVGAHPTVVELDDADVSIAAKVLGGAGKFVLPSLCIGSAFVGGLETLMGLHLCNELVPRLDEVCALKKGKKDVI